MPRPASLPGWLSGFRRLGGDLQFVAMDEPLWNGHEFSGANACHTSISAVAADVAANLSSIRRVFPAVRVGDIEQIGRISPSDLTDQIMQWTKAYQDAFGEPLAFVHFDVVWGGPWQQQLTILVHRLHVAGIKFGIIYNGDRAIRRIWPGPAMPSTVSLKLRQTLHSSPTKLSCRLGWCIRRGCCQRQSRAP